MPQMWLWLPVRRQAVRVPKPLMHRPPRPRQFFRRWLLLRRQALPLAQAGQHFGVQPVQVPLELELEMDFRWHLAVWR